MKTQVEFTAAIFRPMPGEEEKTNPDRLGQSLAEWVRKGLEAESIPVAHIIPEDWGWCVMTMCDMFSLWVGCGNVEREENRWRCFVVAELGFFQRLRKSIAPAPAVSEVVAALKKAIGAEPGITDVRWLDETEV